MMQMSEIVTGLHVDMHLMQISEHLGGLALINLINYFDSTFQY